MATLARQIQIDFPAEFETAGYLDYERWGSFSVLSRVAGLGKAHQSSYRMHQLPQVLKLVTADTTKDYWITQAIFSAFNRRKVNLASMGVAFVDLDYYNFKHLIGLGPDKVLELVLNRCNETGIPEPSVVIDSGKGLQIKWFHDVLPKNALPRWEALQRHLITSFESLGGDHHARDISRVLRVVHTVNQKNGQRVEVLWVNNRFEIDEPVKYEFNNLIARVIPEPKTKRKSGQNKVQRLNPHSQQFTLDSLNWTRLCDLQKLIKLRGGDVGEGMREPMAFYLCNFYGLRYHKDFSTRPLDNWSEFRQLCLQAAPHWDASKIREKTSNLYQKTRQMLEGYTVEYQGRQYPPLYTPKNQTLIELFQITDNELKHMSSILSRSEKLRRHSDREKNRRRRAGSVSRKEYEKGALDKAKQAQSLKEEGLSIRKIAAKMEVSVGAVHGYLKSVQSPCS